MRGLVTMGRVFAIDADPYLRRLLTDFEPWGRARRMTLLVGPRLFLKGIVAKEQ